MTFVICGAAKTTSKLRVFKLWSCVFFVYVLYVILTHSYIYDPLTSFFISRDQMFFYREAISLSNKTFGGIIQESFSNSRYSELPLAIALFASLARIAGMFNISDIMFFEKINVAFIASLIPVFIYKTILLRVNDSNKINIQIFWFAVLSPLLCLSAQLLRDIHICFVYTLMAYVVLNPICKFRYIYLVLLCYVAYSLRVENGLFAIIFFMIPLYQYYEKSSAFTKRILLALCIIGLVFSINVILKIKSVMDDTLDLYTTQSISKASSDSLGVKLNYLPFPLNTIAKTIFAQLLPFPLWVPFQSDAPYNYLRIVECFVPFYWIPILWSIFLHWKQIIKDNNRLILLMLLISLLYLLVCSSSVFTTDCYSISCM